MNHDDQFNKFISTLYSAAKEYSKLLNLSIIFESKQFANQKSYTARFYKENFLHLTGVKTGCTALDFYEKCFNETILISDINNFEKEYRNKIARKLKHLQRISQYFLNDLQVQENFEKNTVSCVVATSDGEKTIGFANTKPIIRIKTLLDRNQLNPNKPILTIKPKTITLRKK